MRKSILAATALTLGCSFGPSGQEARPPSVVEISADGVAVLVGPCASLKAAPGRGLDFLPPAALDLYRSYVKGLASFAGASDGQAERVASSVIDLEGALVQAVIDQVSEREPATGCPFARNWALARRAPCPRFSPMPM